MIDVLRQMPPGVRIVLIYGLTVMAGLAITLPLVVELAVEAPISPLGLLWMLLLAYVIFTLTLLLQRKQAAWMLSVGLATLSLPVVVFLYAWAGLLGGVFGAALAVALFGALRRPATRAWFTEP